MAVKKETPEERAERMMAQSQALKERTDWARICEAIKNKPEHLAYCKKYLLSVGAWPTGPTATALKQAEKRATKERSKKDDEPLEENDRVATLKRNVNFSTNGINIYVELHRNFNSLSRLPPQHLTNIMSLLEPVAWHSKILKADCRAGKKFQDKDVLLNHIEFATTIDPGASVPEHTLLGELVLSLRKANEANGRRACSQLFPIDFETTGVYELRRADATVSLAKQDLEVDITDAVAGATDWTIKMNWSESRAYLSSDRTGDKKNANNLFARFAGTDGLNAKPSSRPTSLRVARPSNGAGSAVEPLKRETSPDARSPEGAKDGAPKSKRQRTSGSDDGKSDPGRTSDEEAD